MERRDLMRLLGASLGGASLASCVKEPTSSRDILGFEGALPPVPSAFLFYLVSEDSGLPVASNVILDHFRLDLAVTDRNGAYAGIVDGDGKEGIWWQGMLLSLHNARPAGPLTRVVHVGDVLPGDPRGRSVIGVHNYDANKSGDLAAILSFADESASAGGPAVTKEVWLRSWPDQWSRLLYAGLQTPEGHALTGVFSDIDVHTNADIVVTAWYQPASDISALRAQNPSYADPTSAKQGLFSIQGGNVATLTLELSDDQLQSSGSGVAALGLLDVHDGGHYVLQAFPSRLRTAGGPGGTAGSEVQYGAGGPYLVSGRIGSGHRGAARLTAPLGEARNPLFTLMGGPSGDAYYGPRAGPRNATAYMLQEGETGTALYYNGTRLFGTGDVFPLGCDGACDLAGPASSSTGTQDTIRAVNPPVFGPEGEVYTVVEWLSAGPMLCATDGQRLWQYSDFFPNGRPSSRIIALALGHLTESVDSAGRVYMIAVGENTRAAIIVGIPQ